TRSTRDWSSDVCSSDLPVSDAPPRGEMPFLDHLEELRWRILWSLIAVLVGTVLGWMLLDRIDIIELLKRPIAPYLPGGRLVFTRSEERRVGQECRRGGW